MASGLVKSTIQSVSGFPASTFSRQRSTRETNTMQIVIQVEPLAGRRAFKLQARPASQAKAIHEADSLTDGQIG